MCVCVMYRICDICDVCVGYTVLDRVIGLLLTKYFKRKSLLKLHLPVGDVPFPFPYNWSNNARGYPLSHAARDTTAKCRKSFGMHITTMKVNDIPKRPIIFSAEAWKCILMAPIHVIHCILLLCAFCRFSCRLFGTRRHAYLDAGFLASECLFMSVALDFP